MKKKPKCACKGEIVQDFTFHSKENCYWNLKDSKSRKTDKKKPKEIIYEEAIARSKALMAKKRALDQACDEFVEEAVENCPRCQLEKQQSQESKWKQFIKYIKKLLLDLKP